MAENAPAKVLKFGPVGMIRALRTILESRNWLGRLAGVTHEGLRDLYRAFGYKRDLDLPDFWVRYERSEVAAAIIEAYPEGTWYGKGEVYETDRVNKTTAFEKAWDAFSERLAVWPTFMRADTLAGPGHYAGILIGAPGKYEEPLPPNLTAEEIFFLAPYNQLDLQAKEYVEDRKDPRFGEVKIYELKRVGTASLMNTPGLPERVHWSRVAHVPCDKLLSDNVHGVPRLKKVWNRLDDLEKVVGGGSEATYLNAHQGYNFNVDSETELDDAGEEALDDEINEFLDGFRRAVRTRGVEVKPLGTKISNFGPNVLSIISLISAATKIPQRILMGSEQGQLASTQDRVNWGKRVQARRTQWAEPHLLRPFVDRMIKHKVLPAPANGRYQVWWPDIFDLSDDERAVIAGRWIELNQKNKGVVVTTDEVRDRILGLPPINDADVEKENKRKTLGMPPPPSTRTEQPALKGNAPT